MEISTKRRLDPGSQHGDIGRIRDGVEPVAERSLTVVIQGKKSEAAHHFQSEKRKRYSFETGYS